MLLQIGESCYLKSDTHQMGMIATPILATMEAPAGSTRAVDSTALAPPDIRVNAASKNHTTMVGEEVQVAEVLVVEVQVVEVLVVVLAHNTLPSMVLMMKGLLIERYTVIAICKQAS